MTKVYLREVRQDDYHSLDVIDDLEKDKKYLEKEKAQILRYFELKEVKSKRK
jgi:hypothetical protein